MNTISFIEHSKPFLYACKHKYKKKQKKKTSQAGHKNLLLD